MHSHASAKQEFHQKSRKEAVQVGQMGTQLYVRPARVMSDESKEKENMSERDVVWVAWPMSCLR